MSGKNMKKLHLLVGTALVSGVVMMAFDAQAQVRRGTKQLPSVEVNFSVLQQLKESTAQQALEQAQVSQEDVEAFTPLTKGGTPVPYMKPSAARPSGVQKPVEIVRPEEIVVKPKEVLATPKFVAPAPKTFAEAPVAVPSAEPRLKVSPIPPQPRNEQAFAPAAPVRPEVVKQEPGQKKPYWVAPVLSESHGKVAVPVLRPADNSKSAFLASPQPSSPAVPLYLPPKGKSPEQIIADAGEKVDIQSSSDAGEPKFKMVEKPVATQPSDSSSFFAQFRRKESQERQTPDLKPEPAVAEPLETVQKEVVTREKLPEELPPATEDIAAIEQKDKGSKEATVLEMHEPVEAPLVENTPAQLQAEPEKRTVWSLFSKVPEFFRRKPVEEAPVQVAQEPLPMPLNDPSEDTANKATMPVRSQDLEEIAQANASEKGIDSDSIPKMQEDDWAPADLARMERSGSAVSETTSRRAPAENIPSYVNKKGEPMQVILPKSLDEEPGEPLPWHEPTEKVMVPLPHERPVKLTDAKSAPVKAEKMAKAPKPVVPEKVAEVKKPVKVASVEAKPITVPQAEAKPVVVAPVKKKEEVAVISPVSPVVEPVVSAPAPVVAAPAPKVEVVLPKPVEEPKIPSAAAVVELEQVKPRPVNDEEWTQVLQQAKSDAMVSQPVNVAPTTPIDITPKAPATAEAALPAQLPATPKVNAPAPATVSVSASAAPSKTDEKSLVASVMEWVPNFSSPQQKPASAQVSPAALAPAAAPAPASSAASSPADVPTGSIITQDVLSDLDKIAMENSSTAIAQPQGGATQSTPSDTLDLASLAIPKESSVPVIQPDKNGMLFSINFSGDEVDASPFEQDRLAEFVQRIRPTGEQVKIVSFAPATNGDVNAARRISLKRAIAIRSKMIALGLDGSRINVQAVGSPDPAEKRNSVQVFLMENS